MKVFNYPSIDRFPSHCACDFLVPSLSTITEQVSGFTGALQARLDDGAATRRFSFWNPIHRRFMPLVDMEAVRFILLNGRRRRKLCGKDLLEFGIIVSVCVLVAIFLLFLL